MKDTSSDTNITSEYWETPIVDHQFLWFSQQVYTGLNNYLFFENDIDGPADPIYVLTIGARETFKISDESDSCHPVRKEGLSGLSASRNHIVFTQLTAYTLAV